MNIAETAAIVNALNSGGGGGSSDGGYDLVIMLESSGIWTAAAGELIYGDFPALEEKALAKKPINALVYGAGSDDASPFTTSFGVIGCVFDNYGYALEDHNIRITCAQHDSDLNRLCLREVLLYRDETVALGTDLFYQDLSTMSV